MAAAGQAPPGAKDHLAPSHRDTWKPHDKGPTRRFSGWDSYSLKPHRPFQQNSKLIPIVLLKKPKQAKSSLSSPPEPVSGRPGHSPPSQAPPGRRTPDGPPRAATLVLPTQLSSHGKNKQWQPAEKRRTRNSTGHFPVRTEMRILDVKAGCSTESITCQART